MELSRKITKCVNCSASKDKKRLQTYQEFISIVKSYISFFKIEYIYIYIYISIYNADKSEFKKYIQAEH